MTHYSSMIPMNHWRFFYWEQRSQGKIKIISNSNVSHINHYSGKVFHFFSVKSEDRPFLEIKIGFP